MSVEDVLPRALNYLKRSGYRVDSISGEAERLVELFKRGVEGRPAIKPYHVDPPSPALYSYLDAARPVVYAEQKLDGTHIQVSGSGLFKHNGDPVASDQLGGLIYVAVMEPEKARRIMDVAEEGYVVEVELFGSRYTPMGFHKGYEKPFDVAVFEVGLEGRWIPPPEKYEVIDGFNLPRPGAVRVEYDSVDQLREKLESIAHRPDWFEGAVVKAPFTPKEGFQVKEYVKTGSLLLFKVKKRVELKRRKPKKKKKKEREEPRVYLDVKEEAVNEVAKLVVELGEEYVMDARNTGVIIERIVRYLDEAHPTLVERFKAEGLTDRDLRRAVGEAVMDAKRRLARRQGS